MAGPRTRHRWHLPLRIGQNKRGSGHTDPKPEKYAGHKLREGPEVWSCAAAEEGSTMPKKGHSEEQICGVAPGRERHQGQ